MQKIRVRIINVHDNSIVAEGVTVKQSAAIIGLQFDYIIKSYKTKIFKGMYRLENMDEEAYELNRQKRLQENEREFLITWGDEWDTIRKVLNPAAK